MAFLPISSTKRIEVKLVYQIGIYALLLLTFFVGMLVQYKLINTGRSRNLISAPSFRRRHRNSTPLTGGIGILFTFFLGLVVVAPNLGLDFVVRAAPLLASFIAVFAVGLVDDVYVISPKLKLLGELVSASILLLSPDIQSFALGWQEVIGYAIWPLILFWVVGVTNAINLIDGLDGLAASYGLMSMLGLIAMALVTGTGLDFQVPLMSAMVIAVGAFFVFNKNPAQVFLGDNGSLLLGFSIATFALLKPAAANGWNETMSIILVAGYPLLDMGWVTITRIRKGFSPFSADRSHIHYRLIKFKLSVNETVLALMCLNTITLSASYLLVVSSAIDSLLILGYVGAASGLVFTLVGNFDRWKNQILAETPQKPTLIESVPESTEAVLRVDLRPIFQALDTTDQRVIEAALESLYSHLQLNFRKHEGFSILKSRADYNVTTSGDSDEFFDELSDCIRSWLRFYDIAISLPNLPIAIIETQDWPAQPVREAA